MMNVMTANIMNRRKGEVNMSSFVYICVALSTAILIGMSSALISVLCQALFKLETRVGATLWIIIPCLISGCLIAAYIV